MNRTVPRWAATLTTAAALLLAHPSTTGAAPQMLADSTWTEQWTLANGLRVATRHVAGASGVAIALAFGTGTASDPPGREGLSWLLAETWFTAPAGEVPERTHAEMASLRPLGWTVKALPRATQFVEVATPQQFPGVLHQTALRMRGVRVTPRAAQSALAGAREHLPVVTRENLEPVAWVMACALAAGADSAALRRLTDGAAPGALAPRELERLLRERFVPSNAVLSLTGNLGDIALRPLIEREFGGVPAGRAPAPPSPALRPATVTWTVPGLSEPAGVLGVIAPAITDTTHPEFFLNTLVVGAHARESWGAAAPPFTRRFSYSLFEDPDLVRFFPPLAPEQGDTEWLAENFAEILAPMAHASFAPEAFKGIQRGVSWMLGGPLTPSLAQRARTDIGLLTNLSTTTAMRALWQPEAFWADYRRRFDDIENIALEGWCAHAVDAARQVRLVFQGRATP